jgi:WD40 repeat protein
MQARVQKHRMNRGLVARPFRVCVAVCALMTALCVNLYAQARPDILWARSGPGSILAFSPDRRLCVMNTRLVRVSDGMVVRRFAPEASSAAFSPDGAILALGSFDGAVRLVRVSDGVWLRTLSGHTGSVNSVAFSPDGTRLASGSSDNTVRLWRVSDGTHLRTLPGHTGSVNSVAFSPDGTTLASGSSDNTVRLWRVSDGTHLRTLPGHTGSVNSVAFSPDGTRLASGSSDNTVRLWRVSDGASLRTLSGHTDWVLTVAFSPDGTTLASGSWDNTVRLWRVSDGTHLRTLSGHTDRVVAAAFSPDGSRLYTTDYDGILHWRLFDGRLVRVVRFLNGIQVEFSANNPAVILYDRYLVHTLSAGLIRTFPYADTFAISPDGQRVAGGSFGYLDVYNALTGELLYSVDVDLYGFPDFSEMDISFSPDGSQILVCCVSQYSDYNPDEGWYYYLIYSSAIYRSSDGELVQSIPFAERARFIPGSSLVAYTPAGASNRIRLYDTNTRVVVRELPGHLNSIEQLAVSLDGKFIASIDTSWPNRQVRLWRVSDGVLLHEFNFRASSIAFTADSQFLAAGGSDGIMFWRVSDGALVQAYTTPEAQGIKALSLAPNLMVYAQSDGTLVLARISLERRSLIPVPLR